MIQEIVVVCGSRNLWHISSAQNRIRWNQRRICLISDLMRLYLSCSTSSSPSTTHYDTCTTTKYRYVHYQVVLQYCLLVPCTEGFATSLCAVHASVVVSWCVQNSEWRGHRHLNSTWPTHLLFIVFIPVKGRTRSTVRVWGAQASTQNLNLTPLFFLANEFPDWNKSRDNKYIFIRSDEII